jgi:hypothetical protein
MAVREINLRIEHKEGNEWMRGRREGECGGEN